MTSCRSLTACALALLLLAAPTRTQEDEPPEAARLLFLLEYIGADYGAAVQDGRIANAFEFDEMVRFSSHLVERFDILVAAGASEGTRAKLQRLAELIRQLRPWDEVRTLSSTLARTLMDELSLVTWPTTAPDPGRGAALYTAACAACHGPTGAGDGFGDPAMDPPPGSLRGERGNLLTPHQVFGALRFGIEGTAMPSYGDALPADALWDLAFHVLTLREDFQPVPVDPGLPLGLEELVTRSNDELRALLEAQGLAAGPAEIDYYRRSPPAFRLPRGAEPPPPAPIDPVATSAPSVGAASALDIAVALQDAFASVADRLAPSLLSVTAFVRDEAHSPDAMTTGTVSVSGSDTSSASVSDSASASGSESASGSTSVSGSVSGSVSDPAAAAQPAPGNGAPRWTGTEAEAHMYPGFRRLRSASGFFVDEDGTLLTSWSALLAPDGAPAPALDVELPDGRHVLARLVGAEPTVDLAVLQLEVYSGLRPPVIVPAPLGRSSGVRVGHWMIALGDPWGPERTYAVGTLAAPPQRECYQGELSATLMQSSLTIHPESYGGPLADIHGRVVGMSVPAPGMALGESHRGSEFALPIDLALNLYAALVVAESRRSPWLGFSVLELAAVRRRPPGDGPRPQLPLTGVYIDDLFVPSPAARAGVRIGDSLVSIDGQRLLSVLDFQKWLYLSGIGRQVELELFRAGETLRLPVTIEERPPEAVTR